MGLLEEGFDPSFETDVNDLVRKSAARLSEKGAVVEEVSIPWHLNGRYINFLIIYSITINNCDNV